MTRKSLVELSRLIKREIEISERNIGCFSNNENPQVREMLLTEYGKKSMLESILMYAETGSKLGFRKE